MNELANGAMNGLYQIIAARRGFWWWALDSLSGKRKALARRKTGGSAGEGGDLLANRRTNPQPPRGRNSGYSVHRMICTGWVRGSGGEGLSRSPRYRNETRAQSCLIFSPGAFHIPVMVLSSSPTEYRTDFGDKPQVMADRLQINATSHTIIDK